MTRLLLSILLALLPASIAPAGIVAYVDVDGHAEPWGAWPDANATPFTNTDRLNLALDYVAGHWHGLDIDWQIGNPPALIANETLAVRLSGDRGSWISGYAGIAYVSGALYDWLPGDAYVFGGWSQLFDPIAMAQVISHETGHLLGLGHSDDPASIMYHGVATNGGASDAFTPAEHAQLAATIGTRAVPEPSGVVALLLPAAFLLLRRTH